ncbi:phosphohistidine phosphatase SixA [Agaribacter flavus]|uniref:Phosphohistidine phosphatase SixA n=1 Tax=Agaribacter flavus TaxID=1902781 RepID=A0ABV7FX92_9ALTE
MNLIIMRHGEAEPYETNDRNRHLTRFGKTQSEYAGRRLAEYLQNDLIKPEIDHLIVSPYLRTQQTYEAVSKKIMVKSKIDTDLITPEANIEHAADYIHAMATGSSAPKNLMLISHMPFVSLLADKICFGFNAKIFTPADILIVDYNVKGQQGKQLALIQSIN